MLLVVDCGSQFTQLIARRLRDNGIYCEVVSWRITEDEIKLLDPRGFIISGSGESTLEKGAGQPQVCEYIFSGAKPVLGICYGMQLMAKRFGGDTAKSDTMELGQVILSVESSDVVWGLDAKSSEFNVWMSHGDQVSVLPEGWKVLASTVMCPIAAMAHPSLPIYGVQFHPEAKGTSKGDEILVHFANHHCGCPKIWTPTKMREVIEDQLTKQLGADGDILLGLSGGVDSSVAAVLLHKMVGKRLKCVMVDTGLLRKNEAKTVKDAFNLHHGDLDLEVVDASARFMTELEGVSDPEEKRIIIGKTFIEVFEASISENPEKYGKVTMLAQGTIYPDVIESGGSGGSALIKTHHNVGGLPKKMKLRIIEPLRILFKDEVRKLGKELGLPHEFVWRHPFPGPGLGVRILEKVDSTKAEKLRSADDIFISELRNEHLYDTVSQAFAVLLPVRSVAVKGDARAYEEVVCLRAIQSDDFMTATSASLPLDFLRKVARRICNEVQGVSRVTFDLTDKPPGTIEWE